MKKFLIFVSLIFVAGMAAAGEIVVPMPEPEPEASSGGSGADGALVLLALIGMVIASSALAGTQATKREADPYVLPEGDDGSN